MATEPAVSLNVLKFMNAENIRISDYQYYLPDELIARYPLSQRDASRLLVYKQGSITEESYSNLHRILRPDSFMIVNDTKVVAARLLFQKSTGGIIEIFCLEPAGSHTDVQVSLTERGSVEWKCLIGGASKWKKGQVLTKLFEVDKQEIKLYARYVEKSGDAFIIRLSWTPETMSFAEVLQHTGAIPLPPYLKRDAEATDTERYQTIFAQYSGSVAAPTAGLHFTPKVLAALRSTGIRMATVTLHVGAGTFLPVKTDTINEHTMHAEWLHIPRTTIEQLIETTGPVVAVGTTTLRTLESLYHIGKKLFLNPDVKAELLHLSQWEAYQNERDITVKDALTAIIKWLDANESKELITQTQLIIIPGYKFKIVEMLITNFHQPHSTLLLLVAAFIGDEWKTVYRHAVEKKFRFLSYGDGCLLFRNKNLPV